MKFLVEKMKKWSGGVFILALAVILLVRYCLIDDQTENLPQKSSTKQSAYEFFNPNDGDANENADVTPVIKKVEPAPAPIIKPGLINLEGLSELFDYQRMLSMEESVPLLAWNHMRSLLSRSDGLPETAQGVKEAAIAWKDLISAIMKEKASKVAANRSNTDNSEVRDCPSVTMNDTSQYCHKSCTLQLPCGLVEDSSITVVGIPNGSFQIKLLSGVGSRGSRPPIILNFNVSLPGEELTEESVIVQNSWTTELGWGKSERCPNHGEASEQKVDGLVICNQQIVRSTMNSSHPSSGNATKTFQGSAHASASFPFAEGNLFGATLWAGAEGFHMTVNGRHETSFAYREMLEPWLVSEVEVVGNLTILSGFAKDLPVSEDFDLIMDIKQLKAPPVPKKRLLMLVGVFSTGNNFKRRMALRRTWMQYPAVRSGNVAVRFFIGLHKNNQVNAELWREAQAYGDIQFMPFVDYYSLISLKTIAICIFGTKVLPAKYLMKTDDDAFVRIDEVLSNLKSKEKKGLVYGRIAFGSEPERDKENKWSGRMKHTRRGLMGRDISSLGI
uniref:Galectin domain-containing protein n=1 Tax=Kalanchoe fedtschenkoi TaxID=63787 RepID=A0A7N0UJZ7_KALFE